MVGALDSGLEECCKDPSFFVSFNGHGADDNIFSAHDANGLCVRTSLYIYGAHCRQWCSDVVLRLQIAFAYSSLVCLSAIGDKFALLDGLGHDSRGVGFSFQQCDY